jgi:hypothetical protein
MNLTELVCEDAPDITTVPAPKSAFEKQPEWAHYDYEAVLYLAYQTRSVMLAVVVELRHLYFKAWDKSKPFKFGNTMIKRLNFDRRSKDEALRKLERAGTISVTRPKGQAPLITILQPWWSPDQPVH